MISGAINPNNDVIVDEELATSFDSYSEVSQESNPKLQASKNLSMVTKRLDEAQNEEERT